MDKWRRGSFTVEAALLVPVLVYLMIAMVYIDFWLFDQVAAQGLCCQAAWQLHMAEGEDAGEMRAEEMALDLNHALQRAVICGEVLETECSTNGLYSRAECGIGMNIPLRSIRWVLGNDDGYESAHAATVSGLASMTMFRKLCAAEEAGEAGEERRFD